MAFSELRRALHNHPCYFVFLSTTGKITQFTPAAQYDISSRLHTGKLSLLPPFCELGFDQLAKKAVHGETTLDEVSSLEFMTSFGRPLFASRFIKGDDRIKSSISQFAIEKLLCKEFSPDDDLSDMEKLISVRLPLEFNPRALRSQDTERTLVEKHMRVCIGVDSAVESAVTIVPSEPILAEASYLVMKTDKFDLPHSPNSQMQDSIKGLGGNSLS